MLFEYLTVALSSSKRGYESFQVNQQMLDFTRLKHPIIRLSHPCNIEIPILFLLIYQYINVYFGKGLSTNRIIIIYNMITKR